MKDQRKQAAKTRRALKQSRPWKRLSKDHLAGHVVAVEVTDGRNGAHVHSHTVMVVWALDEAEAKARIEALRPEYMRQLKAVGLHGSRRAFDVVIGRGVCEYIGKWGLAGELGAPGAKAGKNGNRSLAQLLSDYADGDEAAGLRFVAIGRGMKGAHQLEWSPGFEELVGADRIEEDDALEEGEEAAEREVPVLAQIMVVVWRQLMLRNNGPRDVRAQILTAARRALAEKGAGAVQDAVDEVIFRILAPPGCSSQEDDRGTIRRPIYCD